MDNPTTSRATRSRPAWPGRPLVDTTFVVVDLETTGLCPGRDRITEIGAVKVRAGEVLGELSTLVRPGRPVPAPVAALTGITDAMLRAQPPIGGILPMWLEFARGAVLVAHNADFDSRFLNAALRRHERPPLDHLVVDTLALARHLLADEVGNLRLSTLARHLGARTQPAHRALTDARATVEVLHALLERLGSLGGRGWRICATTPARPPTRRSTGSRWEAGDHSPPSGSSSDVPSSGSALSSASSSSVS